MINNKNILDKAIIYLAGGIENCVDDGIGWRRKFIRDANDIGLCIDFIDPTNKPDDYNSEIGKEKETVSLLRESGQWKKLTNIVKKIVRFDLRSIDLCDAIIAKIDPTISSVGTVHEIVLGDMEKKPVFLIVKGGKKRTPIWLFGILDHKYIFDDEESLLNYLVKINNGEIPLNDRWVLFRNYFKVILCK